MFTTDLVIKKVGDQTYDLVEPLVWNDNISIIQVNPKFDFDAISIPKIFWSIIDSPFTGKAVKPATLHDALYASEYFERKVCDDIFLEAMESEGVPRFKRLAMYYAVRMFGGSVWKGHNQDEVKSYRRFITVV